MGRTAYTIVVAGLCCAGWLVTRAAGLNSTPLTIGIVAAGTIQVVAFWHLAGRLSAGQDATRVWIGGIAARSAAFGAVALLAYVMDFVPREAATAFAFTLITLVLLEAIWLAVATRRTLPVEG